MTGTPAPLRLVVAVLLLILPGASCARAENLQEVLRGHLLELGKTPTPSVGGSRLLQPKAVLAFYQARKGQPAWVPDKAKAMRQAIADIEQDGLDPSVYHLAAIDVMLAATGDDASRHPDAELEILLTDAVADLIDDVRYGRVQPKSINPRWNVNSRQGAPPLERALIEVAAASDPVEGIDRAKLDHFIYRGLKEALSRLRTVREAGGWPAIPKVRGFEPGDSDATVIPLVRKRLAATGELPDGASLDTPRFDAQLAKGVTLFRQRHRMTDEPVIDRATLEAMNVPVEQRIDQVRVNLERARWVLPGLGRDFLLVNLPAFKAYLIRGDRNVWEARTMIGKQARQTPVFRADMRYLVFNPDWTVPPTILEEDVLGGMRRGEDMIAKKNLVILDRTGGEVDPASIDWASATPETFPYTLRQLPGPDNALGRVKFIFPNEYDIYLHDTPSRELFSAGQRTFSSGCIRMENPLDLARLVLEGKRGWDAQRIQQAVDAGTTQQVTLPKPLPVLIVYWTVSVGATGEVRFASDVYDLDPVVLQALENPDGMVRGL